MKSVTGHVWKVLWDDEIWDGSATLSFYFLLGVFPSVVIVLGIASFLPIDDFVQMLSDWSLSYVPEGLRQAFQQGMMDVELGGALSVLSLSLLAGFWAAVSGIEAVLRQLNRVYGVAETRGYWRLKFHSLLILLALGFLVVAAFLMILFGTFLTSTALVFFELPPVTGNFILLSRVLMSWVLFMFMFSLIYRLGPRAQFVKSWHSAGSLWGGGLFLVMTQLFAFYLERFADYGKMYGAVGASIGVILWFYILGFLVILGAEINCAILKKSRYRRGIRKRVRS